MDKSEYRFHKGARTALIVAGVLCILLVIAAPIGIWIIVRATGGKVVFTRGGLVAKALFSVNIDFADVTRLGVCRFPIVARGIGGALARYKVGGDHAINVCVMTRAGKTRKFIASMYEDHEAMIEQISRAVGRPYEELTVGAFGVKWPQAAA